MEDSGKLPRKLAVIMHADVVGSTELVRRNEIIAHERIQATFQRLSKTIEAYRGITHELRGDALLAEFQRASDAVSAALSFQSTNTENKTTLTDDVRPEIRIGISLGEVVIADNTVTGSDVVLAQRLEQLAAPGSLCISQAAYQSIPRRLPFDYEDLGNQAVKGFDEPVRAYAVRLRADEAVPPAEASAADADAHATRSKSVWLAGFAAVVVLGIGASLAWLQPWAPREEPASVDRMAFSLPDKPSIAVLPFDNMSADPEQEYFVDGMTEDLITDISKLSGLFVIARNSVFTYKGKAVKVAQVAEELGVRYVLEGSVRRAGDEVRINAQLIDTTTGNHLWAERYDGTLTNVFDLQDQVTRKIVAALAVELTNQEEVLATAIETSVPDAYDAFLRGWSHYQRQTRADFSEARKYFETAVVLDENYSRAYAALAALYWETHIRGWQPAFRMDAVRVKKRALEYWERAMTAPTPLALVVGADMLIWRGRFDEAIRDTKRAIEAAPNDAHAQLELAKFLIFAGQPQDALEYLVIAERLDPHGKARQQYIRGLMEFGLERFESAAVSIEKALQRNPDFARPAAILAATYGHLGRKQDAIDLLTPYEGEYWANGVGGAVLQFPYQHERDKQRLAKGFRLGGMKEFY